MGCGRITVIANVRFFGDGVGSIYVRLLINLGDCEIPLVLDRGVFIPFENRPSVNFCNSRL